MYIKTVKVKTFGGFLENRANLIGFLEPQCTNKNMTHLGIDINNTVYFLTVTGRDDMGTTGYDLEDLARLCSEFKIHTAINLDGGRSSLITEKSDGYIRVSNINSANAYPVGNILSYINY